MMRKMPAAPGAISPQRQALLAALLDGGVNCAPRGRAALRPLWANEAMHRAHSMLALVGGLERHAPSGGNGPRGADAECRLAAGLAASLRSLAAEDDSIILPCADVLKASVRSLADLFGPAIGHLSVHERVGRLALPAYRRRALVLMAVELVANAIRHGFAGRKSGRITVTLRQEERSLARLGVTDDGCGIPAGTRIVGIAADLAAVFGPELVCRGVRSGGTSVEVVFPAHHQIWMGCAEQDASPHAETDMTSGSGATGLRLGWPPPSAASGSPCLGWSWMAPSCSADQSQAVNLQGDIA